jgi:hypothetical protein
MLSEHQSEKLKRTVKMLKSAKHHCKNLKQTKTEKLKRTLKMLKSAKHQFVQVKETANLKS